MNIRDWVSLRGILWTNIAICQFTTYDANIRNGYRAKVFYDIAQIYAGDLYVLVGCQELIYVYLHHVH